MSHHDLHVSKISRSRHPLLLRTCFNDRLAAWQNLVEAATRPYTEDGFRANISVCSYEAFADLKPDALLARITRSYRHAMLFVADETTFASAELPVLVIGLVPQRGDSFRCIPSELWSVENNLSLANMDFDDFAGAVQPDGVFRGFP